MRSGKQTHSPYGKSASSVSLLVLDYRKKKRYKRLLLDRRTILFISKSKRRKTTLQLQEQVKKLSYCKWCKAKTTHTSMVCFNAPRKELRKESVETKKKRLSMYMEWEEQNPPDRDGYWYCYLRINPNCLYRLTKVTLEHEHVIPRSRRKDLQYDIKNIRPACSWCNYQKGSQSLEKLSLTYPHLQQYLSSSNLEDCS